jgi:hypothetical protein
MKTIIITIALILVLTESFSQAVTVPNIALSTFEKDYNTNNEATDIIWTASENNYVVYFEYNGKKRSVLFDESGNYKENRIYIPFNKLHEVTAEYILKNYGTNTIIQCYEVNSNTAPFRNEVEIEIKGDITTLCFRPNGEFHYQK